MTTSRNEGMKPAYCAWCDSNDCIHAERDNMTVELAFLRKVCGEMGKALKAWKSAEEYARGYAHLPDARDDITTAWEEAQGLRDAALSAAGEAK